VFLVPWFEDGIYEALKGCQWITHSKEYNQCLKKASPCFKGCFPLVFITNSDVIVSPSYIEFAEELHPLEVFNAFCEVWEQGYIFADDGIEWSIVYDIA
jgi:hypothetical protein